jgi:hypothetical protein
MGSANVSVCIAKEQAFASTESEGYAVRHAGAPAFVHTAGFVRSATFAKALLSACMPKGKATADNAGALRFARMASEKGQNAKNAYWLPNNMPQEPKMLDIMMLKVNMPSQMLLLRLRLGSVGVAILLTTFSSKLLPKITRPCRTC